MTIDEEIVFERKMADYYKKNHLKNEAREHEQRAEWLEELKDHRERECNHINEALYDKGYSEGYNKAIDDFIHECDKHCGFYSGKNKNLTREDILCISEQLKAGGENESK